MKRIRRSEGADQIERVAHLEARVQELGRIIEDRDRVTTLLLSFHYRDDTRDALKQFGSKTDLKIKLCSYKPGKFFIQER